MKNIQRILALVFAALFLFSFAFFFVDKGLIENKVKTSIDGIEQAINAQSSSVLEREIEISPCNNARIVLLQLYNSSEKKYYTVNRYITGQTQISKIKISFPKEYRLKTYGKWRVQVLENKTCQKAEKIIEVTSNNIENKELASKSACVYCVDDNTVLYDNNCHKKLKPASTTKVMTATLLLESNKLNDSIEVSKKAANTEYSKPEMKKGDVFKNRDLLYAIMLASSNGAAVSIAESVNGSTGDFIEQMNKKVKSFGRKDTHFASVHGLDMDNHYSSAYDIAFITGNIYKENQLFRNVIATDTYVVTSKEQGSVTIRTTDKLRGYSSKHKGGKTGFTSGAGYCFSGVYVHEGKTYVACVLGAKTGKDRWNDMKILYKYIDKYGATNY